MSGAVMVLFYNHINTLLGVGLFHDLEGLFPNTCYDNKFHGYPNVLWSRHRTKWAKAPPTALHVITPWPDVPGSCKNFPFIEAISRGGTHFFI